MGKMSAFESAIAWGLAVEALASSKQVAVSILHDLIAQIPPNLPDDLRNRVNERVALRCLEELFGAHDAPPVRRSKLSFELSESCQQVLRRIVNETAESDVRMGGGGKWKWDIEPFIEHKRASMPTCALNKLKDSVVDWSHPYAELFGRKSGLAFVRVAGSDGILGLNGGCSNAPNIGVEEARNDESALPSKRGKNASETEKVADENYDGSGVNAKKMKMDDSYVLRSAQDNSVPLAGREMLEDSLERDIPVSQREKCVLSEFRMDMRVETWALEDGRDDYTASKRSGDAIHKSFVENPCAHKFKDGSGFSPERTISGIAPPHETQHKVSAKDSSCNIEHEFHIEVPHPVSVDGSKQKSIADKGKGVSEHCPELTTSPVAPPDVSQKKTIADGVKDLSRWDFVTMEKRDFLSSKCALTRYYYLKEKDHCLMCNEGGQLLICSTSDCPLAYHESCMGSKFISYKTGDFYCPFCAYDLDLTEYLEAEKEASRLKKDLWAFLCLLGSSS
ncbi:uncharacterized protein LOC133730064 [Rosa rugosa]|uniref:uncharacterized protein LOC133730064 n=1 Tax=Rosa rugosa TaxID=74645 RepID=UPI002B418422|nr:uncharacterized protein LOC133730064 [Rosa rugosa]